MVGNICSFQCSSANSSVSLMKYPAYSGAERLREALLIIAIHRIIGIFESIKAAGIFVLGLQDYNKNNISRCKSLRVARLSPSSVLPVDM